LSNCAIKPSTYFHKIWQLIQVFLNSYFQTILFYDFGKTKNIKEFMIIHTKALPPWKFSHNRHSVILLKMGIFGGGLALVPNYGRQY
jgi:hypothetical protein